MLFPFSFMGGAAPSNTPRTQAFLTATGITDATIISALNDMDTSLISAGLLPVGTGAGKIKALYPFVGSTATTHKFNFVNPADSDAAFRLQFNGGWTHDANGAQPNGTNGWANTFLTPSIDFSGAYYEGTYHNNSTETYNGAIQGGTNAWSWLQSNGRTLFFSGSTTFGISGATNNGFHQMQRGGGNDVSQVNTSRAQRSSPFALDLTCSNSLAIGAINNGSGRQDWNNKLYKLRAYGSTFLTNTELDNFNSAVQAFQTALSRA